MCCYGNNDVPIKDIVSLIALIIVFVGRAPFFSNLFKLIALHFYLNSKCISTNHGRSLSLVNSIYITILTSCSISTACDRLLCVHNLTFCLGNLVNDAQKPEGKHLENTGVCRNTRFFRSLKMMIPQHSYAYAYIRKRTNLQLGQLHEWLIALSTG